MVPMAEEAHRELREAPRRLFSDEFLFLLERIDRVEANLRQKIDQVEAELRREISEAQKETRGTLRWVIGLVLTTLGLVLAVAIKVWH